MRAESNLQAAQTQVWNIAFHFQAGDRRRTEGTRGNPEATRLNRVQGSLAGFGGLGVYRAVLIQMRVYGGDTVSEEFIGPLPNRGGINDRGGPRVFVLRSGGDEAQVQSHTEEPSLGDFYGAAVEGEMR